MKPAWQMQPDRLLVGQNEFKPQVGHADGNKKKIHARTNTAHSPTARQAATTAASANCERSRWRVPVPGTGGCLLARDAQLHCVSPEP